MTGGQLRDLLDAAMRLREHELAEMVHSNVWLATLPCVWLRGLVCAGAQRSCPGPGPSPN